MKVDDWRGKTRTDDGQPWAGYTFIRVNFREAEGSAPTASASTAASVAMAAMVAPRAVAESSMMTTAVEEEESDGSFEFLRERP